MALKFTEISTNYIECWGSPCIVFSKQLPNCLLLSQLEYLQKEKELLEKDLDAVHQRHKEELEIQQLQHFEVKKAKIKSQKNSFLPLNLFLP